MNSSRRIPIAWMANAPPVRMAADRPTDRPQGRLGGLLGRARLVARGVGHAAAGGRGSAGAADPSSRYHATVRAIPSPNGTVIA